MSDREISPDVARVAELLVESARILSRSFADTLSEDLIRFLEQRRTAPARDPLMTVAECAAELGLGKSTIRKLVNLGVLKRAPGLTEIMIRKSVLDSYGKEDNPKRGGKKR